MPPTTEVLRERKSGYLPSLDGWRAIAILGVMMTHDLPWTFRGYNNTRFKDYGGDGVVLFFAISGLLITTRILEEESICGFFDIRRFYIRRIFRIQPAAIVYLTVVALLITFHVIHDGWSYWFGALLLYENFIFKTWDLVRLSFFTGHFWTLAVEEHFYILLSLILLYVRRYRVLLLIAIILVLDFALNYAIRQPNFDPLASSRRTYWQLHFLLLPAAVAIMLRWPHVRSSVDAYLRPWVAFLLTAIVVALHYSIHLGNYSPSMKTLVGMELGPISRYGFVLWIVATMFHPRSWTTRFLESPPLRFVGKISYSLYLWHILFFFYIYPGTNITNPILVALGARPAKYIAAFGCAILSYYLVERPMMRLGHRLAPPARAGRPELEVGASS